MSPTFSHAESLLLEHGRGVRLEVAMQAGSPGDHGYRPGMGMPVGQRADYRKPTGGALAFHLQSYANRYELHLDFDVRRHPFRHALEVLLSWRQILALRTRISPQADE